MDNLVLKFYQALEGIKTSPPAKYSKEELKSILSSFAIRLTLASRKTPDDMLCEIRSTLAVLSAVHYDDHGFHVDEWDDEETAKIIYRAMFREALPHG
jgi:hypothetical protein